MGQASFPVRRLGGARLLSSWCGRFYSEQRSQLYIVRRNQVTMSSLLMPFVDRIGDEASKLCAYNISTHTADFFSLPYRGSITVGATEKELGLVCVHPLYQSRYSTPPAADTVLLVGNPLLEDWKTISLPQHRGSGQGLGGVALRRKEDNFFAYRLFAFFLGDKDRTLDIEVDVFDSESGLWTRKQGWTLEREYYSSMFTVDGSKAYFASEGLRKLWVAAYDLDGEEWSLVTSGAAIEKRQWDSDSNHSKIDPTLVLCNGSLYVIGRTLCHRFLRVWRLQSDRMVCVSEYYYEASNTRILFASDGKKKLYACAPDKLIEYNVESNDWSLCASPQVEIGMRLSMGDNMFSGEMHLHPSKPHIVKALKAKQVFSHNSASSVLLVFMRNSSLRVLPAPISQPFCAAVLREMDLICTLPSQTPHFPCIIWISNTTKCCWEEIHNAPTYSVGYSGFDRYEPLAYEFVGVSLKPQQQASGYFLYYFYMEKGEMESKVHVRRYDSVKRSWDEIAEPCRVDARTYKWTCSISGGSSSCKDRIYLSNIRFYRRLSGEPKPTDADNLVGAKMFRSLNKMRAIAFDSINNVWDDAVLPKEGVLSPCDPDPCNNNVTANIVVCGGRLFVVGRSDGDDIDTVGIWTIMNQEGVTQIETTVTARAWRGSVVVSTDGVSKIYVAVLEREDALQASKVMEYELQNKQWTSYPLEVKQQISSFIAE